MNNTVARLHRRAGRPGTVPLPTQMKRKPHDRIRQRQEDQHHAHLDKNRRHSRQDFTITKTILNGFTAFSACGLSAGMMMISPAFTFWGLSEIVIFASPSRM